MKFGPHPYTAEEIDRAVLADRAGYYVLGKTDVSDRFTFHKRYVGRSDHCLRTELKAYLERGYDQFWFEYASSPAMAFFGECRLFHELENDNIENIVHPDLPDAEDIPPRMTLECPVCGHPNKRIARPPANPESRQGPTQS